MLWIDIQKNVAYEIWHSRYSVVHGHFTWALVHSTSNNHKVHGVMLPLIYKHMIIHV